MSLVGFIPFAFVFLILQMALSKKADAQNTSSVVIEGGAINIAQRSTVSASGLLFSVLGSHATANTTVSASALLIGASNSSTAAQGSVGAQFALPQWPSLRAEFSGTGTAFGARSVNHGASRDGFLRPQIVREHVGVFGTLAAGTVSRNSVGQHALAWDVGAWTRHGMFSAVMTLRRSFTNDSLLVEASDFFLARNAHHYAMQDVQAIVTARHLRFELVTSATLRRGVEATTGRDEAISASLTTQLSSTFAFVVNAGKQLAEPLSGVPAATVVGASLRVHLMGGRSASGTGQLSANTARNVSPFVTRIDRHATGGATVVVRVDAPVGALVELTGTFNDWAPLTVPRVGDAFELTIELPRGTHRIAVRVNGGEWKAPAGLARAKDDLGGESGIVIVP